MFVVSLIMLSSAFLICTNRLDWALEIKRLDVDYTVAGLAPLSSSDNRAFHKNLARATLSQAVCIIHDEVSLCTLPQVIT